MGSFFSCCRCWNNRAVKSELELSRTYREMPSSYHYHLTRRHIAPTDSAIQAGDFV